MIPLRSLPALPDFRQQRQQEALAIVHARAAELAPKLGVSEQALLRPKQAREATIRVGRATLVYVCRRVDGLTYVDIAHALGVAYGTVYQLHKLGARLMLAAGAVPQPGGG